MGMDWDPDYDAQARRDRIRNWVIVVAVTLCVIGFIAKLVLAYQREKAEKERRFGRSSLVEPQQPPVGRQLGPAGQLTSGSSERGLFGPMA